MITVGVSIGDSVRFGVSVAEVAVKVGVAVNPPPIKVGVPVKVGVESVSVMVGVSLAAMISCIRRGWQLRRRSQGRENVRRTGK